MNNIICYADVCRYHGADNKCLREELEINKAGECICYVESDDYEEPEWDD